MHLEHRRPLKTCSPAPSWMCLAQKKIRAQSFTSFERGDRERTSHSPQFVSGWCRSRLPQAKLWLPLDGEVFLLLLKELFTPAKGLFLMRISICSASQIIANSAGVVFFLFFSFTLHVSQGVTSLQAEGAKPSHKVLPESPGIQNEEMCQLSRGEDYPAVYGTNMIPNFSLTVLSGLLPPLWRPLNGSGIFFDPHFKGRNKEASTEISSGTGY